MHFATLRLLRFSRSPEERRDSCLELAAKISDKALDGKIKHALAFFFSYELHQSSSWVALQFSSRGSGGRCTAEEFQVGDTCKASAAQKQLRKVILLRGAMQFCLIFVPPRKIPRAEVAPFREPGSSTTSSPSVGEYQSNVRVVRQ